MNEFKIVDGKLVKYNGEGGDVVIPNGVTEICVGAFDECEKLVSVVVPDSVTLIGVHSYSEDEDDYYGTYCDDEHHYGLYGAFSHCGQLKSIIIPEGVARIGSHAFCYTGLTGIEIPDSVTEIGDGAFYGCESLKEITLPDGLKEIGEQAFMFCKSLGAITLPEGLEKLGKHAFKGCAGLKNVTLSIGAGKIPINITLSENALEIEKEERRPAPEVPDIKAAEDDCYDEQDDTTGHYDYSEANDPYFLINSDYEDESVYKNDD